MTVLLLVKLVEHHTMKSWQLVPAMILDSDLERHDDDDGATYKAVATYEYQFEMASVPGVVGGSLAGAIMTNRHLDAQGERQAGSDGDSDSGLATGVDRRGAGGGN
jgi:hypothetical protein